MRTVRHRSQRLTQGLEALEGRLPLRGEPVPAYALRSEVNGDDVMAASVRTPDVGDAWVVYVQTIVDEARVYDEVLRPLQRIFVGRRIAAGEPILPRATAVSSLREQVQSLLDGNVVIFASGTAACIDVKMFPERAVAEATTEKAIVGSKQAFTEGLASNLGAIRALVRDPNLRVEIVVVGHRSRTRVALLFIADLAKPELVHLMRQGLYTIDTAAIHTTADLAEFLVERSLSTVPLAEESERVERAATAVLSGRLCLLVDGTPFAMLVPTVFLDAVKDTETALPGPITVSFVRMLRLAGMFLSVAIPGLYAAVLTANTALLPTALALAVAASRTGVPYPVLTETLVMLVLIDIFSEATAQAPGGIGNALSIVGTLIIGQMAVQARLASSLMMIVVATTVLGSFLALKFNFSYTLRIWKYPIVILGGLAGLFGWMVGLLLMLTHFASLKSAGVPYMSPVGPLQPRSLIQSGISQPSGRFWHRRSGVWDAQDIQRTAGSPSRGGPS